MEFLRTIYAMLEKQGGSVDLVVLASSRTFPIDESSMGSNSSWSCRSCCSRNVKLTSRQKR